MDGKSMNLLVFDTVLNKTFITLAKKDDKTAELQFINKIIESDEKNYHSAYLISEIKNILNENGINMDDIEAIAVNIGPGSFTGIRVCLSVASVIAGQLNLKLIPVPSVEILSRIIEGKKNAVFLDARRNNYIYFDPEDGCGAKLIEKSSAIEFTKKHNEIVADKNCCEFFTQNSITAVNYEAGNYNLGEILAKLAIEKLIEAKENADEEFHFSRTKPLYLQTPPVF